ncbi:hypothetical protein B0H21DRAFT_12441 [Amylocystis lapponica]|nr:hypothetical protein B0H21DRAFT_12441 [Amylocystis lapponica]
MPLILLSSLSTLKVAFVRNTFRDLLALSHVHKGLCDPQKLDPPFLQLCLLKGLLPVILAVVSALSLLLLSIRPSRTAPLHVVKQRNTLQVLRLFLTPTRSFWPETYLKAARRSAVSRDTSIIIPLRSLVDDILAGRMELRNTMLDLPELVAKTLKFRGWEVRLRLEMSWWTCVSGWILAAHFELPKPNLYVQLGEWMYALAFDSVHNLQMPDAGNRFNSSTREFSGSSSVTPFPTMDARQANDPNTMPKLDFIPRLPGPAQILCMDTIPHPHLETAIRTIQSSLETGAYIILKFTTRGPSVSFMSTSFVFAALPFLPRRHVRNNAPSDAFQARLSSSPSTSHVPAARMTAPLFNSLSTVLGLLTTGPTPLTVHSVKNISEERATSLNAYVHQLEDDTVLRAEFASRWGMEGWREEKFYAAWEAALLASVLLEEWLVVVQKAA